MSVRRARAVRALLALVVLLLGSAADPVSAMMEADKFIGTWRPISAEFHAEDGSLVDSPYGTEPQGVLMYDAEGNMAAQLSSKDRTPFAVNDRWGGTAEETRAAFGSYQAYFGRYVVDEREHTVTHLVAQALLPNWIGTKQVRYYKFQDGRLILRTPVIYIGGKRVTGTLVWEKVRLHRD